MGMGNGVADNNATVLLDNALSANAGSSVGGHGSSASGGNLYGMAVANFCGQPFPSTAPAMVPSFRGNTHGLGLSVPMSIKQKIWDGAFVDF